MDGMGAGGKRILGTVEVLSHTIPRYIISQIAGFSRQLCHFVQNPQVPVQATIGITIPRYFGTTNRRICLHGLAFADPSCNDDSRYRIESRLPDFGTRINFNIVRR